MTQDGGPLSRTRAMTAEREVGAVTPIGEGRSAFCSEKRE